jgi:endonuclease/exonuclease/phosphatase (EEP) superfamily protein YafD
MKNDRFATLSFHAGRVIGAASGVAACGLWLWALGTPQGAFTLSALHIAIGVLMMLFAIFAVIASVRAHGMVLLVIFVMSFFPVGGYLLGTPLWLRWVGVADFGFLAGGLLIWRFAPKTAGQQAPTAEGKDR